MGSATGGGEPGSHGPLQILLGGSSNAFPPSDFRKNSVMYTINVVFFFEKKTMECIIIVYILLKFSKTSKFFLKNFQNCQ